VIKQLIISVKLFYFRYSSNSHSYSSRLNFAAIKAGDVKLGRRAQSWIIQGEHKVFSWAQTFITRKLLGIQTYFF